jgi:diguanylate cyclase (GGDEF)-like protein
MPFSGGEFLLLANISWDNYRRSWLMSQLINVVISVLLLISAGAYFYERVRDVRQRRLLEDLVKRQEHLLQQLPIAVVVVDAADGRIRFSNPVMREQFGSLAAEGEPLSNLFKLKVDWRTAGQDDAPVPMLSRRGQIYAQVSRTEMAVPDQTGLPGIVLTFLDVTERHLREQQLLTDATTDALTGLANRRHFDIVWERMAAVTRAKGQTLWVLALDLDHFKKVNDSYGHDAGDLVLQQASRLLQGAIRGGHRRSSRDGGDSSASDDVAARLGGEEFAALLATSNQEQAQAMAERVRQVIAGTPVHLADGRAVPVTASIGLALLQPDDPDIYAALKRADQALYTAKQTGRNRVVVSAGESLGH